MSEIKRARCCPGSEKKIREQVPEGRLAPITWGIALKNYQADAARFALAQFRGELAANKAEGTGLAVVHPWFASVLLACGIRVDTRASLLRAVRPHIPYGRRLVWDDVAGDQKIEPLRDEAIEAFASSGPDNARDLAGYVLRREAPWLGVDDSLSIAARGHFSWFHRSSTTDGAWIVFGPSDDRLLWGDRSRSRDMRCQPAWPHRVIYGDALDCAALLAEHDFIARGDPELVPDLWNFHRGLAAVLDKRAWSSNAFLQCAYIGDWLEEHGLSSQAWTYRYIARVMAGEPRPAPARKRRRRATCAGAS